jgi:hypothetical protein
MVFYSLIIISGQWDHSFHKFYQETPNTLEVIWKALPFPIDCQDNYGFTQFALELNGILLLIKNYKIIIKCCCLLPTLDYDRTKGAEGLL